MHRYIPVLAANAGFKRITEKEVKHQARPYGSSKFGTERFIRGFLDLVTLWFISRFGGRPMHFFRSGRYFDVYYRFPFGIFGLEYPN